MNNIFFLLVLIFLEGCIHVGPPRSAGPGERLHRVRSGESLTAIAARYRLPWQALGSRNRLRNPHKLMVGQVLIVPRSHRGRQVVAKGGVEYGGKKFSWPVDGKLSSYFGMRRGRPHRGIDIKAERGTPVLAARAGKVSFAGWMRGYGKTVIVNHGKYSTLYAHLSKIKARRGDWYGRGRVLGLVGATGNATGNHLHFEIRRDGRAINPMTYYASLQ